MNNECDVREIRFETRLAGATAVIRISDTGPGVPEHLRLSMCVAPDVVQGALSAFRSICA